MIFCIIEFVISLILFLTIGLSYSFLFRLTLFNSIVVATGCGILLFLCNRGIDAFFDFKVNPIICIVVGIAVYKLVFFIHHTKVGFWILSIIFSIIWGFIATSIVCSLEPNLLWHIVAFIIAFACCIKLHMRARDLISLGV